jgi:hypothetical protein
LKNNSELQILGNKEIVVWFFYAQKKAALRVKIRVNVVRIKKMAVTTGFMAHNKHCIANYFHMMTKRYVFCIEIVSYFFRKLA